MPIINKSSHSKKVFVLTGMHRSGTSVLARGLEAIGISLGNNLYPAGFDNPTGFWEDNDILEVNEKVLAELGSAYDQVGLPYRLPLEKLKNLKIQAKTILNKKLKSQDIIGFKDPRICRLFPFWEDVLSDIDAEKNFIIALRNPVNVFQSLEKRNGFCYSKSNLLWLEHLTFTTLSIFEKSSIIVNYDSLLSDPKAQLIRVANKFNLTFDRNLLKQYCKSFVNPDLRHNISSIEDLKKEPACSSIEKSLYFALLEASEDKTKPCNMQLRKIANDANKWLEQNHALINFIGKMDKHLQTENKKQELCLMWGEFDKQARSSSEQTHLTLKKTDNIVKQNGITSDSNLLFLLEKANLVNKKLSDELKKIKNSLLWKSKNLLAKKINKYGARFLAIKILQLITPNKIKNILISKIGTRYGGFNADFYLSIYPDVVASGMNPHLHYIKYGRHEGRLPSFKLEREPTHLFKRNQYKPYVLVVFHDGSRTGAPILGYNIAKELKKTFNVITLFLRDGPIFTACKDINCITLGPTFAFYESYYQPLIYTLLQHITIKFAVTNSIESYYPLRALTQHNIPTVNLIHEFASYTRPSEKFLESILWANITIFSSVLTKENAVQLYPELINANLPIVPQGRCSIPTPNDTTVPLDLELLFERKKRGKIQFLVAGLGTVQFRKGVDLFLSCAAQTLALNPNINVFFLWIGHGYDTCHDISYSVYLEDQIERSNLKNNVLFLDEVSDLTEFYSHLDAVMITSRLDPLPNVGIDALCEGVPVLSFENATGISNILTEAGFGNRLVSAYLDSGHMAKNLIELLSKPEELVLLSSQLKLIFSEKFSFHNYMEKLIHFAQIAAEDCADEEKSIATMMDNTVFNLEYAFPKAARNYASSQWPKEKIIQLYLRRNKIYPRKPCPGFHPIIYSTLNTLPKNINPFRNYIENSMPMGPWKSDLITPKTMISTEKISNVGIHIHVFYPENLQEILNAIKSNNLIADLLISVPNKDIKSSVLDILKKLKMRADLKVFPNAGRDLGPFFTGFSEVILKKYDYIAHFHTKNSPHMDSDSAKRWSNFLIQNLLGGKMRMADRILGELAHDSKLGLVFPDDPNIVGWNKNLNIAQSLAKKLGVVDLPNDFIFPVGSMFWAKVDAIRPLFNLNLQWQDYPSEPIPGDGTILHALERIISFSVLSNGYTIKTTFVSGVSR